MNTHDKIELPPLPPHPPVAHMGGRHMQGDCQFPALYKWAKAYAISAIEADRKRRGEQRIIGEILLDAKQHPFARLHTGYDENGDQWKEGTPIYAAPQPAEPIRGEPVAWIRVAEDWSGAPKVVIAKPNQEGAKPVYLAPQPTEPTQHPSYDRDCCHGHSPEPECKCAAHDAQPAEPVRCECGPVCQDTGGACRYAEPVKVPSDDIDAARWQKARTLPRSWWRDAFNRIAAEGITLDALIDAETKRRLP